MHQSRPVQSFHLGTTKRHILEREETNMICSLCTIYDVLKFSILYVLRYDNHGEKKENHGGGGYFSKTARVAIV